MENFMKIKMIPQKEVNNIRKDLDQMNLLLKERSGKQMCGEEEVSRWR